MVDNFQISGSLMTACLSFIFIGVTGIAGLLSQFIGPITITPLMILLTISIVPTMEEKMSLHWISIVYLSQVLIEVLVVQDVMCYGIDGHLYGTCSSSSLLLFLL